MGGPVKAIREATPQARHSFTVADQVNQLVSASEADPDRGFMARTMARCSLPRSNPGNRPRLILAWICTEAVRTQNHELVLGKSLADFMRSLGVYSTSGGKYTRLRNQMKRLFGCSVSMTYEDKHGEQFVSSLIAERGEFWWNERKPDEPVLWESKIELSEKFFNEIIRHPVPLDLNTLMALKRSPLGLDLYLWLAYRTFALDPDKASDKQAVKLFRRRILRELKKIKIAWPGLNYSTAPGVLILLPSNPAIAPAQQLQLVE